MSSFYLQVSRPQVVKRLWAYLKEKNLQVKENSSLITVVPNLD